MDNIIDIFNKVLAEGAEIKASDIHLCVGSSCHLKFDIDLVFGFCHLTLNGFFLLRPEKTLHKSKTFISFQDIYWYFPSLYVTGKKFWEYESSGI